MQFGFNAPTAGPMSATEQLARLVVEGEALGFDYATFSDHVVIPTDIDAKYPYSATGEFPAGSRVERHEQLIEMAFVAAKTKKLRLVSSVMVVPHRPAVLTAKMLSTIDVLSGGRLVRGHRRRLDEGGVRGDPGARFRRSAARSPTNTSRPSSSSGPSPSPSSRASTCASTTSCSTPSRCRSRIRRSGSAAKADRRCAAPRSWATPGIRSAPTRPIRSTA